LYFGCEADDPVNAWASTRASTRMASRSTPSSVPTSVTGMSRNMREVVAESYELVEHGLFSAANYRAFVFGNIVDLWGGANAEFFADTVIADAARRHLQTTR